MKPKHPLNQNGSPASLGKGTLYLWTPKAEPALFDPDDEQTCFRMGCRATPEYRVITAEGDADGVEGGIGISLLCHQCAINDVRSIVEIFDGNITSEIPAIAFMLLPLHIESRMTKILRANLTPEVCTRLNYWSPATPGMLM